MNISSTLCKCGCLLTVRPGNTWCKGHNPKVSFKGELNPMKRPEVKEKHWEKTHSKERPSSAI